MMNARFGLDGLFVACMMFASAAWAQSSNVTASEAWVRSTVAGQGSTGAYLSLLARENTRLLKVDCPQAQETELHEMVLDGGMMRMRRQAHLELPAGKRVMLKPGSYHIMLTGLKTPLRPGQTVLLKLHLADRNGKTEVIETHAEVRGFAARSEDSQRAATTAGHHSHLH